MIRAVRWCGYAWLATVVVLGSALLLIQWLAGGVEQLQHWLDLEFLAIFCASLVPGIAMILMEVFFERRHGIDEDR